MKRAALHHLDRHRHLSGALVAYIVIYIRPIWRTTIPPRIHSPASLGTSILIKGSALHRPLPPPPIQPVRYASRIYCNIYSAYMENDYTAAYSQPSHVMHTVSYKRESLFTALTATAPSACQVHYSHPLLYLYDLYLFTLWCPPFAAYVCVALFPMKGSALYRRQFSLSGVPVA